jgi:anaerobic magnesium-protoporphyrin IX monomethyl ester cyclase
MSGLGARVVENLCAAAGHTVRLFDFPASRRKPSRIPLPDELAHLRPYVLPDETGRLAFFTKYQRLGPPVRACAETVRGFAPDLILISCFAFCYVDQAADLAAACKTVMPDTPIVAGGHGPAVLPAYLLRRESVDACVTEQAEATLPGLLDAVERHGALPATVSGGGAVVTGPIGAGSVEPTAAWHATRLGPHGHLVSVCLTRGCPRRCSFCSVHLVHGREFRRLPISEVRRIARALPNDGSLEVNLEDDNLLCDWGYTEEALEAFRRERPGVRFRADNGLDYRLLTPERVRRLAELGMSRFNFSVGAADPAVASHQNREADLPRLRGVVEQVAERGHPSVAYLICGLPGDTPESVATALAFAAGLPSLVGVSLFYPIPGLPGFTDPAVFLGSSARLAAGSSAYPWNGSLSTAELVTAFRLARLANLRKEASPSPVELEALERSFAERRLHTVLRRGSERVVQPVPHTSGAMQRVFFAATGRWTH